MKDHKDDEDIGSSWATWRWWLWAILALAGAIALEALTVWLMIRLAGGSQESASWGATTGFFSGAFSALGLIAVAATLYLQARTLSLQRAELRLQRRELEMTRVELTRSAAAQEAAEVHLRAQAQVLQQQMALQLESSMPLASVRARAVSDVRVSSLTFQITNVGAIAIEKVVLATGDASEQPMAPGGAAILEIPFDQPEVPYPFSTKVEIFGANGLVRCERWTVTSGSLGPRLRRMRLADPIGGDLEP